METNLTNLTDALKNRRQEREHISHSTMLAYATHCTDSFETEPFNEVDSLLLSWMSYLHIPEEILPKYPLSSNADGQNTMFIDTASCTIRDFVKEEYREKLVADVNSPDKTLAIVTAAASNPRFANIRFCLRREELDAAATKQFAAITCQIRPELTYIAFRGTDHSMTGWKEDFRMCLKDPVPAQKLSAEYLNMAGSIFRGKMLVGGHSKGGNLAVYSAANCNPEVQERIQTIYSHDGPGFNKEELEKAGYAKIRSRIQKTAPQFSIFGMLLRQEAEPKIIYSYGHGILQHDATSWKTDWYGLSEYWYPSKVSQHIKNKLNNWIESLTDEEKETFIDVFFGVIEQTGIDCLSDLKDELIVVLPTILKAIHELDDSMQMFLLDLLKQFIFASDENTDPVAEPKGAADKNADSVVEPKRAADTNADSVVGPKRATDTNADSVVEPKRAADTNADSVVGPKGVPDKNADSVVGPKGAADKHFADISNANISNADMDNAGMNGSYTAKSKLNREIFNDATPRIDKYSAYPSDIQDLMRKYDSMESGDFSSTPDSTCSADAMNYADSSICTETANSGNSPENRNTDDQSFSTHSSDTMKTLKEEWDHSIMREWSDFFNEEKIKDVVEDSIASLLFHLRKH